MEPVPRHDSVLDVEIGMKKEEEEEEEEPLVSNRGSSESEEEFTDATPPARSRWQQLFRHYHFFCVGLIFGAIIIFVLRFFGFASASPPPEEPVARIHHWPGWDKVENHFIFGDSYSDQWFDPFQTQPHSGNPFGNPDFLLPLASGSNWVHFLGLQYNASFVRTFDFAVGGSTVDPEVVTPFLDNKAASFVAQHRDKFRPIYTAPSKLATWKPENSLFSVWFGINDIALTCSSLFETPTVNYLKGAIGRAQRSFRMGIEELYGDGARNFLFLTVPPFYYNFLEHPGQQPGAELMEGGTLEWNKRLIALRDSFVEDHPDATIFLFDTWELYETLIDQPMSHPQTKRLRELHGVCDAYKMGTNAFDEYNKTCGVPVNQWFWLNDMHPTYPAQDATAARVVRDCFAAEGPIDLCS